jgi:hypothetical protein
LDTVPEPMIVPATRSRARRMGDEFVEAVAHRRAIGRAKPLAVPVHAKIEADAPVAPGIAQFIGRDGKGAMPHGGLAWTQPNPVFISGPASVRSDQSLTCTTSRMWFIASAADVPIGTASTITPNSPSKSMPSASSGTSPRWIGA